MADLVEIHILPGVCIGSGMCVSIDPSSFTLEQDEVHVTKPIQRRNANTEAAAVCCPVEAIELRLAENAE